MSSQSDRAPGGSWRRPAARVALSLAACALVLLLAEGALRLAGLPRPVSSGWLAPRTIPDSQRNELGYRGHPIRYGDEDRVVCLLGDSQVESGTATGYDEMPERLLERGLARRCAGCVRVVTVGVQGWGTDQELLALREYFQRFRADLVALWLTPRNDVWNNTFPTSASGRPKPTFRLKDGELIGGEEPLHGSLSRSGSRLLALLRGDARAARERAWDALLPPPYLPLEGYAGPVGELRELWSVTQRVLAFEDLEREKSHLAMYLTPPSPRLRYGIELTRRLLREVEREAGAHGAGFFLFTTSIENSLAAPEPVVVRWGDAFYRVSRATFDEHVRALMEGFDGAVLAVPGADWAVGPEDRHLDATALRAVMDELADRLAPRLARR